MAAQRDFAPAQVTPAEPPHPNTYYAARAPEYERVYDKPERQADLATLKRLIPEHLRGADVLEVACGTGYWTRHLAKTARRIVATDLSTQTLAVARAKGLCPQQVVFEEANAMALPDSLGTFNAAFAGFWWSHIPRQHMTDFLGSLHRRLSVGAKVLVLDNRYVSGSSTPIAYKTPQGDTYQRRQLADGARYEVLKNFPTEQELRADLSGVAKNVQYQALDHYWLLHYERA
jgi:demethylmenaquinone methyltransferase/2-methoxy-6-polyprenyl-1,4-benzoquinol methylase